MENQIQSTPQSPLPPLQSLPMKATGEVKAEKLKEYDKMFKILYKQADYTKIKSLALELKEFDPGNKSADKWAQKADKKVSGKGFFGALFSRFKKTPAKNPTIPLQIAESKSESKNLPPIASPFTTQIPLTVSAPSSTNLNPPVLRPIISVSSPPVNRANQVPIPKPANLGSAIIPKLEKTGNTFTKMFGGSSAKETTSIIDRIVAKTGKKENVPVKVATNLYKPLVKEKKEFNLLSFSKLFMNFTAVFIFLTGTFLYVEFLDKENRFLGLVGVEENTGSKLHGAAQDLTETKRQVAILENEIKKYKTGYEDASLATVQTIINQRINWPDVFFKIKEVTNSVYELNDFFKYVEYDNYAFDAEKQTIRITGRLSDPQGRNLTKLVELEEAFMYYPHDKNNPEDPTKPFFQGFKEMTTLTKSIDKETGRYVSDFQLSFSLNAN